jgi:hypothetical protein
MTGEMSPHASKRQRKLAEQEKENVFRDSAKANMVPEGHIQRITPWEEADDGMKRADLSSDLFSVSLPTIANGRT